MSSLLQRIEMSLNGRSEAAIQREAGLGESFIRDIRRKEVSPSLRNIEALASVLGKTPWWLAFGIGPEDMVEQAEIARILAQMPEELRTEVMELLRLWKDLKPRQLQGIADFVRHSLPSVALPPARDDGSPPAAEPSSPGLPKAIS